MAVLPRVALRVRLAPSLSFARRLLSLSLSLSLSLCPSLLPFRKNALAPALPLSPHPPLALGFTVHLQRCLDV